MAEKLKDIVSKVKQGAIKTEAHDYAKAQINFDALFDKHAQKVCPGFKTFPAVIEIKQYLLALAAKQTFKGLYLYGDVGVGKTTIFRIMWSLGKELYQEYGYTGLWFTHCTAPWLVQEKMESVGQGYTGSFDYELFKKGKLYIDDLGLEPLCFNNYELLGKLLFDRQENKAITFVSSNMTPDNVADRYGDQIYDRMGQMFHIIKWEGESLREGS